MLAADNLLYIPSMHEAECELAYYLVRLLKTPCESLTPLTEGLKFQQPQAVINACTNRISILTGGPGTGKTTTTRMIVKSFLTAGLHGMILCPASKAARRAREALKELAAEVPCHTIHHGLKYNVGQGRFLFNRNNKLPVDFLICDEISLGDLMLSRDLLEAIDHNKTRIVLVGDPDQLPSVQPGNVARDIINSGVFPMVKLTEILRQGKDSGIVYNAKRIIEGEPLSFIDPISKEQFNDFYLIKERDEKIAAEKLVEYICTSIPQKRGFDAVEDIQALSPGKKSVVGTGNLSENLSKRLNPDGKKFGNIRIGDKVINTKNDNQLVMANGDVGIARDYSSQGGHITFDFGPGAGPSGDGFIDLKLSQLDNIYPAWCYTIHRSQGSEFPCMIMPVYKCHNILLFRNLLYTGVTRARELCILIGDPQAVDMCINNDRPVRRTTRLESIIRHLATKTTL